MNFSQVLTGIIFVSKKQKLQLSLGLVSFPFSFSLLFSPSILSFFPLFISFFFPDQANVSVELAMDDAVFDLEVPFPPLLSSSLPSHLIISLLLLPFPFSFLSLFRDHPQLLEERSIPPTKLLLVHGIGCVRIGNVKNWRRRWKCRIKWRREKRRGRRGCEEVKQ